MDPSEARGQAPEASGSKSESEWDDLPELESWSEDDSTDENYFEEISSQKSNDLEDLPELEPLSDDSDDGEEDPTEDWANLRQKDEMIAERIKVVLTQCRPFPGDRLPIDPLYKVGDPRFVVERLDGGLFCIYD